MALRGGKILIKEQRLEYTRITDDLSKEEIAAYYTLSSSDLEIVNRHTRDYNRLGSALQLCVLRYLGWPLSIVKHIPLNILNYVADQNRLIQLSRIGERYETQALQRFDVSKRYAILVIYLLDLSQELIDFAIEIHDRQMMHLESNGRRH